MSVYSNLSLEDSGPTGVAALWPRELSWLPTIPRPKSSRDLAPLLHHPDRVMFLDIETTGLSRHYDYVTAIGFEVAGEYSVILAGEDPSPFVRALADARSIVTFNGSTFDLPFLQHALGDLPWPAHHVDLRYACRRIGLTGGQKRIEQALNVVCRAGMEGVDGAMAVLLWHRYLRGDMEALGLLIDYNRADVRAMAHIVDHVLEALSVDDLMSANSRLAFNAYPDVRLPLADAGIPARSIPPRPRSPVSFHELFDGTPADGATVVGLDLTGSAARPSGFCVLRGDWAETQTLDTDEAIISRILDARPALVSIDSPLCLPNGRTTAFDDDPARHHGIMRRSELTLKRRGINVYPCLLPSMQRLTDRGIRLANTLREAGLAVIECYPGAAQDIMGIPRKGAGQEMLRLGMSEFGVQGPYQTERVTHDELDAVTCSIVGMFHLAGMTEGLGGPEEEPMIIPMMGGGNRSVIGISGLMMSGKTSAARALEDRGFDYTRISLVIDDVIRERGGEPDRDSRQAVGMELHRDPGQRWLCARALEKVPLDADRIVVDGLRWSEDVRYMRERFGGRFVHLHIVASRSVREARARASGREDELETAGAHPVESGIENLEGLADAVILNDGSLADLEKRLGRPAESMRDNVNAG